MKGTLVAAVVVVMIAAGGLYAVMLASTAPRAPTSCNVSAPLSLTRITVAGRRSNGFYVPELVATWSNCSPANVKFSLSGSNLNITTTANGVNSTVTVAFCTADCGGDCVSSPCTFDVSAQSSVTLTLVQPNAYISPNFSAIHIVGAMTAYAANSEYGAISPAESFDATG